MHSDLTLRRRGFTIIELLVVISIIGLLTALAATSYVNAQRNARDNTRKTNVNNIATAVETYYRAVGRFPGLIGNEVGDQPDTSERSNWQGCMAYDSVHQSTIYYYFPVGATTLPACGDSSRQVSKGFDPGKYQPASTWIPDLGAYLNPLPIETRYQAGTGGCNTNNTMDGCLGSWDSSTPSSMDILQGAQAFSLFYRHLVGGYMVYAELENQSSDAVTNGTSFSSTTQPQYAAGGPVQVNATNVYMILK